MSVGKSAGWKEYGFLVILAALCLVVTVFQFRWTGDLAKAEYSRLERNQRDGVDEMTQAFDRELGTRCRALLPEAAAVAAGPIKALQAKAKLALEEMPEPWFRRIGLVVPEESGLRLVLADPKMGAVADAEWPTEWGNLYADLWIRAEGGGGWNREDADGWLLDFPVMDNTGRKAPDERGGGMGPGGGPGDGPGGPGGGGGGPDRSRVRGWLVVELDREFVRTGVFPRLAERYLDPMARGTYEVRVTSTGGEMIFSEGSGGDAAHEMSRTFNRQGRDSRSMPGPPAQPVWRMTVQRQPGALEKMVARSRTRNLVLAGVVNGLILLAGAALVRNARKARQLAEARMDFVASVSHELRTPVAVILGAAHNLGRGIVKGPEGVERYAGKIRQHAEQLSEMVEGVLEFAAADGGRVAYAKERVSPAAVVRQAVDATAGETQGMEMEVRMEDDLPEVIGDAPALARAVGNLIHNAAKHAVSGGWIGVRVERRNGSVVVAVSDRGPGVPGKEQDAIFQPFFRGAVAKEQQIRGSGIGLGLVRAIVHAHGGEVTLATAPEGGAVFTILLPGVEPERN
ncbi:MAG: HAMP domain-containing sensor histidine kinase [Luteolibacter sp.]